MNGQQNLAVFPGSLTGLVRSTIEQAKKKKMKEIESWLLKNAVSFGFLARQALLIVCRLLTLMELLQTAEDQGEEKKTYQRKNLEHNYAFQVAFAILLSLGRI